MSSGNITSDAKPATIGRDDPFAELDALINDPSLSAPAMPEWINEKALFEEFLTRDIVFCDGFGKETYRVNARDHFTSDGFETQIEDFLDMIMGDLESDNWPSSSFETIVNDLENALRVVREVERAFYTMKAERALRVDWEVDDPRWDALRDDVYSPATSIVAATE